MIEYSYYFFDITDGRFFYFSDYYTDYGKMIDSMRYKRFPLNSKTFIRRWTGVEEFDEFEIDKDALLRDRASLPTSLNKSQAHLHVSSKNSI